MVKRTVLSCIFFLCFFSVGVTAQTGEFPRSEVFVGHSVLVTSAVLDSGQGIEVSYTRFQKSYFGWEANASLYNSSFFGFGHTSQFLLAGPRVVKRWRWVTLNFHGLGGIGHYSSNPFFFLPGESGVGPAWSVGGGVDLNFNREWGMRLLQVDVTRIHTSDPSLFDPRGRGTFLLGVVYKWGDVKE